MRIKVLVYCSTRAGSLLTRQVSDIQQATCTDIDLDYTESTHSENESGNTNVGYKIVGDNLDKTVKARYMRDGARNQSLHYFHYFAIKNRVDLSELPDVHPQTCIPSPELKAIMMLPSVEDDKDLRRLFAVHVSRVLATHIPYFKNAFEDVVEWHINHKYYSEMSLASEVVSYYFEHISATFIA